MSTPETKTGRKAREARAAASAEAAALMAANSPQNEALAGEAEKEAEDQPSTLTVTYKDRDWILDNDGDGWSIPTSVAFAKLVNQDKSTTQGSLGLPEYISDFLAGVLGPVQWEKFQRIHRTADLSGMLAVVMAKFFGAPAGE